MESHRSLNPINLMVELMGDKWTLLILRDILLENKRYFSEFRESAEKISSNILTDRLMMLEQQGLISKRADPLNRQKIIYNLTEKSIDLLPVLIESIKWSLKYRPVDRLKYKPVIDLIASGIGAWEILRQQLKKIHLPV